MKDRLAVTGRAVVVGGANTDVLGFSHAPLVPRDSNPGHARVSSGGVARNIAENLARLGVDAALLTAFGGDHNARELERECVAAGIDTAPSVHLVHLPGSVYLAISDDTGDMALALNDMRALDALTPKVLEERLALAGAASVVAVDANLPEESLLWLAQYVAAPLVVDAVSVAKAPRVRPVLEHVRALKASGLEAGVLLGREIRNRDHAEDAARELVALGVGQAFVTTGAFGVAWADVAGFGHLAAAPVSEIRSATGAGDAFAAGLAYATLGGWEARDAAAFGSACAAIALESEDTVSVAMSGESALGRMEAMHG